MTNFELFDLAAWYDQQTPPTTEEEEDALYAEMKRQIVAHIDNGYAVVVAVHGDDASIAFMVPKVTINPNTGIAPQISISALTSGGGDDTPTT